MFLCWIAFFIGNFSFRKLFSFFLSQEKLPLYHRRIVDHYGNRSPIGNESCWFDRIQSLGYQFSCIDNCWNNCIEKDLLKRSSWWDDIPCCVRRSSKNRVHGTRTKWSSLDTRYTTKWSIPLLLQRLSSTTITVNGVYCAFKLTRIPRHARPNAKYQKE